MLSSNQLAIMRNGIRLAMAAFAFATSQLCLAGEDPWDLPPVRTAGSPAEPGLELDLPYYQGENSATTSAPSRFWGSAEYLMWWPKSGSAPVVLSGIPALPTLVNSASPAPGASGFIGLISLGGVPGSSNLNSTTLAAGNSIFGLQSGARFDLGYWLDADRHFGIEGGYFFIGLGRNSSAASSGSPALAIPYTNASTGQAASYTIAQPSTTTTLSEFVNTTPGVLVHLYDTTTTRDDLGFVALRSSGGFQAFDANGVWNVLEERRWRLDLMAGFRYAELDENLSFASSVTQTQNVATVFEPALGLPSQPVAVNSLTVSNRSDQFNTRNSFYGGQIGARSTLDFDRLSIAMSAQVGFGNTVEVVDINGSSTITSVNSLTPTTTTMLSGIPLNVASGAAAATTKTVTQSAGGLFTQPANIGSFHRDAFAVVPQADFKLTYRFTDRLSGTFGYTFVYMSNVARPGDQIDRNINPAVLAPSVVSSVVRSSVAIQGTDFWAQGLTFGLSLRY